MRLPLCVSLLLSFVLLPAPLVNVLAQESEPVADRESMLSLLQQLYRTKAGELQFLLDDSDGTELSLRSKPVFSWSSLGGWSGDLFVWTGKGRIQMVGCIGSQKKGEGQVRVFQEFHSLADEPVKDTFLDSQQVWNHKNFKLKFQPVSKAPTPGATPGNRLFQMRSLARSYQAGMQVTDDQVEQQMRLLPQPLARETSAKGNVIDSALFCFVSSSGTDPEVFLVLEARKHQGKLQWMQAAARFTTREVWLTLKGDEVWRVDDNNDWDWEAGIKEPYFFHWESTVDLTDL